MSESQTGLNSDTQFSTAIPICSSFTQRTSLLCLNHLQKPCEWVDADLGVLWVESEQIGIAFESWLSEFWPCPSFAFYPTYPTYPTDLLKEPHNRAETICRVLNHSQEPYEWVDADC